MPPTGPGAGTNTLSDYTARIRRSTWSVQPPG